MKKRVKRTKAKSTLKRARSKGKPKKTTSARGASTKKTFLPKVKRAAKKAAVAAGVAATVAAGVAAIGTALSQQSTGQDADHGKPKRG